MEPPKKARPFTLILAVVALGMFLIVLWLYRDVLARPVQEPPPPPVAARAPLFPAEPAPPVSRVLYAPENRLIHVLEDPDLPRITALWRESLENGATLIPLDGGGLRVGQVRSPPLLPDFLYHGVVLREVNGRAVRTREEALDALRATPAEGLKIQLDRGGRSTRVEYRPASKLPPQIGSQDALVEAIRANSLERVRELIDWGADFDEFATYSPSKSRPLTLALRLGRAEIARLLLEKGAGLKPRGPKDEPPPLLAALGFENVDPLLVRVLLQRGADANEQEPRDERPALVMAAWKGSADTVRALLEAGADVNAHDKHGHTALSVAAARRDAETIRTLLSRGAVPHYRGRADEPPLMRAVMAGRGDPAAIRLLLEAGVDVSRSPALFHAASGGELDVMVLLLDRGADPNLRVARSTPLHGASGRGRKEAVDLLLRRGANVDGWALITAARGGHADVVRILALKLPAEEVERTLSTALTMAIEDKKEAAAAALRELGAKDLRGAPKGVEGELFAAFKKGGIESVLERSPDLRARDEQGRTPLLLAIEMGYPVSLVRALLEKGARVDDANRYGHTALWNAAQRGNAELVKLLLERGADPRIRAWGETLLERITSYGYPHVEYLLREKGVTAERSELAPAIKAYASEEKARLDQELIEAVSRKDIRRTLEALDRKADPNVRGRDFRPVLFWGVQSEREEIVQALLESGADVNARTDREGNTALHMAMYRGPAIVELLLRGGADVDAATTDGATPLMKVDSSPSESLAPSMIARCKKPNAKSRFGQTALGCLLASPECVERLLEKGADPDTCDNAGMTVLMTAAERGWVDIAGLLLDGKARVDLLDRENRRWPALLYAAHAGRLEMVKLLLEQGANRHQRGARGESAEGVALQAGHAEVAAYLKSLR